MEGRRAATVIVPTVNGGPYLESLLTSLQGQTVAHEVVVVDNGSAGDAVRETCRRFAVARVLRFESNAGYASAMNAAVDSVDGDTVVFVNDDCTCDPPFVAGITAALDPADGVVMAAGVMRDRRHPELIETAGMELDPTLLAFDYLNGFPVASLAGEVAPPAGPSGAAAAFDREAFRSHGGFDEELFFYWEDVDLILRLRRAGATCALAK